MSVTSRLATAVQVLCILARTHPGGTTSGIIARSLDTNPVVVRRLLKEMAVVGLVLVRPGKDGGVRLARPADTITLDTVNAIVGNGVFAIRPGGNARCPINQAMPGLLAPIFAAADAAVAGTLAETTIAALAGQIPFGEIPAARPPATPTGFAQ